MKNPINADFENLITRLIKFIAATQQLLKTMTEEMELLEEANKKLKAEIDMLKRK
jgi:phage shock protein A